MEFNDTYKPETIGEWEAVELDHHVLSNRRREMGLTQQQVADNARIQLQQYQRLEAGEITMAGTSMRIGLSICRVLQLDPFRFWPGK